MPGSTVFENLKSGATVDEIMEWFDVTREQVTAVLEFAARSLDAASMDREPVMRIPLPTEHIPCGDPKSANAGLACALTGFESNPVYSDRVHFEILAGQHYRIQLSPP
jgi:hypothetical protein